jgi:maleate cis-trans isomerase
MRVGLLIPAVNTVAEEEFHAGTPDDVSVHTARMGVGGTSADDVRAMVDESLPRAVRDIASVRPDLVVLACTAVGAVLGPEGEADLVDRMARDLDVPVVSMNAAVGHALARAEARRVALVTPYPDAVTEQVAAGLRASGLEVAVTGSMGFEDAFGIAAIPLEELVSFVERTVAGHEFDTLFLSCGNLRMREARAALSERFGVPVVASNLAALDDALELIAARREAIA